MGLKSQLVPGVPVCACARQAEGERPWGRRPAECQGAGLWVPNGGLVQRQGDESEVA